MNPLIMEHIRRALSNLLPSTALQSLLHDLQDDDDADLNADVKGSLLHLIFELDLDDSIQYMT